MRSFRRVGGRVLLLALCVVVAGCDEDFYLSEAEVAAYANVLRTDQFANDLLDNLTGQPLDIEFGGDTSHPTIRRTTLLSILRNTELVFVEGVNRQVQLDRLSGELERQLERWIQRGLVLAVNRGGGGARLSRLSAMRVRFVTNPTLRYDKARRAIAFDMTVELDISGEVEVTGVGWLIDAVFGGNGTYPLRVVIDNFCLTGEARFDNAFADSSGIAFTLTPRPGSIRVTDNALVAAPSQVKDGVRQVLAHQLSQPLRHTFAQRYDSFALTNMGFVGSPPALDVTYQDRPVTARSGLHFITRASDGKLHHQHKRGGGRRALTELPFPDLQTRIESDPDVYASGRDRLELAATTVGGDLVYAQWVDVAWTNHRTMRPASSTSTAGYRGKPAIVASAPGQVEIVAEGRNGGLWHLRRFNGEWSAAAISIPGWQDRVAPYRSPVAVISGHKVVVGFLDSAGHMFAILYDLEARRWGQPTSLSSQTTSFPLALAVGGSDRVSAVFVNRDGSPFYRALGVQAGPFPADPNTGTTGLSLDGREVSIGGVLTSAPILVCTRTGQFELVGRDADYRLTHNHYVGPQSPVGFVYGRTIAQGWQGWGDLNGNLSGTVTASAGRVDGFAAVALRTGKVELAARVRPSVLDRNESQFLLHNSYDSERYGTRPWNAVHWRGDEQVGDSRFLGQPALAATGSDYALAYVDGTATLRGSRMAETGQAYVSSFATSPVALDPVAIDPTMVSTSPGSVEILLVGPDGRLRHVRRPFGGGERTRELPAPAGVTFGSAPAVVACGNGYLDVVAYSRGAGLYHWSYRNDTWSNPTHLDGEIVSAPVLAHLGGGQLLLLGVGSDLKVYVWCFSRGAWSGYRQVDTSFLVSPLYFTQHSVSSWGDGSLDVAVVEESSGALYHGRLGPGAYTTVGLRSSPTPSLGFSRVGGTLTDTPVLTAFDSTRLHVLATGTDLGVYSAWAARAPSTGPVAVNQAPPLVWSGYRYLGRDHLLLSGAVKTGRGGLVVTGVDRDGRLWFSRHDGNAPGAAGRWSDFRIVVGQPTTNVFPWPFYRPAVTPLGP